MNSIYLHGTQPEEQQRLSRLNQMLNDRTLAELDVQPGNRVLDVGSGLGQMTRLIARAAGSGGLVIGVERNAQQLDEARRLAAVSGEQQLVEFRAGDAVHLPLADSEWGNFDVAFTRFVLEHAAQPQAIVDAMVRAVRDDGRIVLVDDNHDTMRFNPEMPAFSEVWNAYVRAYEAIGNDPYIGHKLATLLHRAGARPARIDWIFFGSCAGQPQFPDCLRNLRELVEGAKEQMIGHGLVSESRFAAGMDELANWQRLPDAAMWFSIAVAEGVKPAG